MHLQQGGGNPRHPPVGASSHINFIAMSYTMSTTPICYLISFGLSILVVCPASRHHARPFYTDVAIVQFVPYSLYLLSAIFLVVAFLWTKIYHRTGVIYSSTKLQSNLSIAVWR